MSESSSSWARLAKRSTGLLRLNDRTSRHRRIKKQNRYERLAATRQLTSVNLLVTFLTPLNISQQTRCRDVHYAHGRANVRIASGFN